MDHISNIFHDYLYASIFVLISIFSVFWYLWANSVSKKRLPPGPWGLPVVGCLPFLEPQLHKYFLRLAQKYGPIFKLRLGSKQMIVVTSPDLAREIYSEQDINFANRDTPVTALALSYGGSDVVWSPYGPQWRMLRKICLARLLSRNTLDSFYDLRRREVRNRTRYLYDQGRQGLPVTLGDQTFLTQVNLMMNMLWGGTVKGQELVRIGTEFKKVIDEISRLLVVPNVSDYFPWLARFDLQGYVGEMHKQVRERDRIADSVIEICQKVIRDEGNDKPKDFLQFMMKLMEEGDSEVPITLAHVKALILDLLVAGTETSTNTTEFAITELIRNPQLMKKAQQELDEVVGKDKIVEESHLAKLPYIDAIMKETLRLHPIVPLLTTRTPTETTDVGGYVVPKGSKVMVNAWAIQRDPEIWKDPLEFLPERFLDEPFDFVGKNFSFFPFGSGRRICAGVGMAERMVKYTLATLLHSFDWKLPEGKTCDMEESFGFVIKLKNSLVAVPVPRLSDPNLYY